MSVTTARAAGGVIRLRVRGDIDLASSDLLLEAIDDALAEQDLQELLVDLAEVPFCDSTGIAALDKGYGAAAGRGVRFQITDPQPIVYRVLEIVGIRQALMGAA
ncbi:STAS domain-containing protein [Actinoplanes sp. GCM10030250]|uniref:STAS domain-containing protein n=1 Tax=Actinoplanes sp. GCM10030250 TaxID=3273376 RepID=UPI00361FD82E